ncbi:rho GTPase-activating protein 45-like isoform X3 [Tachypleus tridentatus]
MKTLSVFKTHTRSSSVTNIPSLSESTSLLSSSLNDVNNEEPTVVKEDLTALTYHIRSFKESLGKLKRIFQSDKDKHETTRITASERLGELLQIMRVVFDCYPLLKSTELFMSTLAVIRQVKEFEYENENGDPSEFLNCVEQLSHVFCSRVSDYIMGDLDPRQSQKDESSENLLSSSGVSNLVFSQGKGPKSPVLSPEDIDLKLLATEDGVSLALQRAKLWSKYAKDVICYVEKKTSQEMEHARNLTKLAQSMKPVLKEESYLPFQSIYCTALDQDLEYASSLYDNYEMLHTHKFIEPLSARRVEYEKARKQIKDRWHRELKKMEETVSNLRKARALYVQRQQDYEKAKDSADKAENCENNESSSKVDKKRRLEDDTLQKAKEAETTYKACVAEANERQLWLEKTKREVLQEVRELICHCDQTMKAVTVSYFQLQHTMSAPFPVQFQTLCESSRLYEPGQQYMEYVKRLPEPLGWSTKVLPAFVFEPYSPDSRSEKSSRSSNVSVNSYEDVLHRHLVESNGATLQQPLRIFNGFSRFIQSSDTDSISSCQSTKFQENWSPPSPQLGSYKIRSMSIGDEFEMDTDQVDCSMPSVRRLFMSKAAETHSFKKIRKPSRCRECDSYVYFQGFECLQCGLACHKKCLENLAIQCGSTRVPCKMTTFGVNLTTHAAETGRKIPLIVIRCVSEIDQRGSSIRGIYRVSGVKSRVENLCQLFENTPDLVDLYKIHPFVIASVLKRFFMQLSEPLLTFELYQEFIELAKDNSVQKEVCEKETIEKLKELVNKLPTVHYITLAFLIHHLKRISENVEKNNMPPSNLGIVFGPNLLKTSEGNASLNSLIDTVHQAKAIELLIIHVEEIFGPPEVAYPDILQELDELYRMKPWNKNEEHPVERSVSTTSDVSDDHNYSLEPADDSELLDDSMQETSLDLEVPESVRSKLPRCDSDEWLVSEIELDSDKPLLLESSPFIRSKYSFYGKSRLRKVSPNHHIYEGNVQSLENEGNMKTDEKQPCHDSIDSASNHRVPEMSLSHYYGLSIHLNSTPTHKNPAVVHSSTPRIHTNGKSAGCPPSRVSEELATVTSQDKPETNMYLTAPTVNVAGQNILTSPVSAQHPGVKHSSHSCSSHLEQQPCDTRQQKERLSDETLHAINSSSKNREILGLSVLDRNITFPRSRYSLACLPVSTSESRSRTSSLPNEEPYTILAPDKNKVSQQKLDVPSQKLERRHVNTLAVSNKSSQTPTVPLFSSSLGPLSPKVSSSKTSRYEITTDIQKGETQRENSPCSQLHFV